MYFIQYLIDGLGKEKNDDIEELKTEKKRDFVELEKEYENHKKDCKENEEKVKENLRYYRKKHDASKKKIEEDQVLINNLKQEVEKVTETSKVEKVTTDKAKVEEAEKALRGGRRTKKKYFDFVKRVLEQKSKKKAEKKTQEEEKVFAAFAPKV